MIGASACLSSDIGEVSCLNDIRKAVTDSTPWGVNIPQHGLGSAECQGVTVTDSKLQEYKETLLTNNSDHLYTSQDLACGLSDLTLLQK